MAALNESQIRAQAITLLEEKYSYSVIGKKLGRSRSWISKWAKRYKQSPNEISRCTCIHIKSLSRMVEQKYQWIHLTGGLAA